MPSVGLGMWKADPGVVGNTITTAIQVGYRHIDRAPFYCNEKEERLNKGAVYAHETFGVHKTVEELWDGEL